MKLSHWIKTPQRGQADIIILILLVLAGMFLAGYFSEFQPPDLSAIGPNQQEIIGVNPNNPDSSGNGNGNGNGNNGNGNNGNGSGNGNGNGSGNSTGNTTGNGNVNPQDQDQQLQLKTFKVNACANTHAVYLLVDNSGSMKFGNPAKITALKSALTTFGATFQPKDGIALETFSTPPPITRIPTSFYSDVATQFTNQVQSMTANGATYMKDAFESALANITAAKQDPRFANYKFALILLTDGIPESETEKTGDCFNFTQEEINDFVKTNHQLPSGQRCFAHSQDPTDVAAQIKAQGVDIYTIAVVDEGDTDFNNLLIPLMQRVATQPTSPYFVQTFHPDELTNIYKQIGKQICK